MNLVIIEQSDCFDKGKPTMISAKIVKSIEANDGSEVEGHLLITLIDGLTMSTYTPIEFIE